MSRFPVISSPPVSCFEELFVGVNGLLMYSPFLKKMSLRDLYSHVCWYWNHGTISWAQNEEGRYVGVCLIKLLTDIQDLDSRYVHDPDGQYLLIEEAVSDGPPTWAALYEQLHDIWGDRQYVLWDRRERTERKCPRIYTWQMYKKILRRLTQGKER